VDDEHPDMIGRGQRRDAGAEVLPAVVGDDDDVDQ
jgi:hypothetical protein